MARANDKDCEKHLDRNLLDWLVEPLGDLHAQIAQHGVEEPGGVKLNLPPTHK
jgi:hypothetical protein